MSTAIGALVVKCPACHAVAGLPCREIVRHDGEPKWLAVPSHAARVERADAHKVKEDRRG